MKKIVPIIIVTVVLASILGVISYKVISNNNMYKRCVNYIEEVEASYNKLGEDFKVFSDYHGFRITKENNKTYVYMWIIYESYYTNNNQVMFNESASMPYKFTLVDNKIEEIDSPIEGKDEKEEIERMFPSDLQDKVLNYNMDSTKIRKDVKKYYGK